MTLLFSHFLSREELRSVNYYSYFPVLETKSGNDTVCRILPSDDAVSYVLEFEENSKRIIRGEINWFNEPLYKNLRPDNTISEESLQYELLPPKNKACIVINLIDFCYGHSFVKLLNILDFYKSFSESHDIVVLSFGYVKDFLPKDKFSIVHIQIGFGATQKAPSFKPILNKIRSQYETVDFAVLDAYKRFDDRTEITGFFNFFGTLQNPYPGKKFLTFNYRKGIDRSWGGTRQGKNVLKWFEQLRPYFDSSVQCCVIGEKDHVTFPDWVLDKRISSFPNPLLHEYHHILQNSVFTVGLIGSHMLSASVLSYMTIHLTPQAFMRVSATDILNYKNYTSPSYFNHVYLNGDAAMDDYSPARLAYESMMLLLGKISLEYKENCLEELKRNKTVELQSEYIKEKHRYFLVDKFNGLKKEMDKKHHSKIRLKSIISRLKKLK